MKAGIAGAGAIGCLLASFIKEMPGYELIGIHDIDRGHCLDLANRFGAPAMSLEELAAASDLVVEAACARAMPEIARYVLNAGKKILVMSVGGFALEPDLISFVQSRHGNVLAPSGGIAGIDCLLALREEGIDKVEITTVKAPASLVGAPYFQDGNKKDLLKNLAGAAVIFSGSAAEAIRAFPANVNLAVSVSLAGIGFDRTEVKIIADPKAARTRQKLLVQAGDCLLQTQIEGPPLADNPRTSLVAANSAKALLRKIISPLRIGT